MRRKMWNPAADGGVRDRLAWRLDGPNLSADRRALQDSARVDELLARLSDRLNSGRLSGWESNFARSILGQARRDWRGWMPSAKQLTVLEEIVERRALDDVVEPLIEEEVVNDDFPF